MHIIRDLDWQLKMLICAKFMETLSIGNVLTNVQKNSFAKHLQIINFHRRNKKKKKLEKYFFYFFRENTTFPILSDGKNKNKNKNRNFKKRT